MSFSALNLNPKLLAAIQATGFTEPTPIQAQSIPAILEGRDAMACAQTGTGKTAAFVLPVLHRILGGPSQTRGHGPRVLVLTPTRELAQQVTDSVKTFSAQAQVRYGTIIGGVSYQPQIRMLGQPLDLLVATPGRLIDHMNDRRVDLSRVEVLVLDEADKMLDMGFLKPVEKVIAAFTHKPQILLFSATFSPEIEKVAARVLKSPHRVQLAAAKQNHTSITQHVFHVDNTEHKQQVLGHVLKGEGVAQTIIFTATKRGADRLAEKLEKQGFAAGALHGDMKQNARKRTLARLHDGSLQVLVATDVAARGIDVKNLSHVVNYDLPNIAEDYTHRIGRTGRGGAVGIAVTLISPPDLPLLRDIEKRLGKPFVFQQIPGLEPLFSEAEFRKIIPTEPPPGRPKSKPQGGSRGGGYGRPQGGNRSASSSHEGGREGGREGNRPYGRQQGAARQGREGRAPYGGSAGGSSGGSGRPRRFGGAR